MLIAPAMILGVGGVARASGGLLDLVGSLGFAAWGLARLKKNTGVMQTLGKLKFTGLRKGISGVGTTLASVYMGTTAASSAWTAFGSKVSGAASSMKTSIGGLIGRVLDLGTRLLWAGGTIAALKAAAVGGVVFTVTTAAMDPEAFFKKDSFSKIKDNITSSLSDTFDLLTKSWRHAVSGFVDWMASISVGLADLFSGAGMSSLGHEWLKEATAATRKWADLSVDEAARVEKSWQSVNAAQGGLGSQAKSRPVFAAAMKEEGLSPTGSPKELQGLIKATNEHGKLLKVWGDRIDAIRRVEEFAGKKGDAYNEAKAALGNLDAESIRDLDQEFMKYVKVQSAALSTNEKQIDTAQDTNKQLLDLTQALKNVRDSGMMAARGYDKSGKVVDKKIMNPEIRAGLMELFKGQGVDVTKVPYAKGKVVIDDASLAKLAQTMIEANGQMLKRAARVTPALAGKADTQSAQNQAQFNEILELYKKSVGDDTAKRLRIKLLKKEQKNALKLWKDFFANLKLTKFFKEANRMAPEFAKVTGGVKEFFKTLKNINTRIKSVIDTKAMKRDDPRIKADVDPAVQMAIKELEGLTAQFIASKAGTEKYAFFMANAGEHARTTIDSLIETFPELEGDLGELLNVIGSLTEGIQLNDEAIRNLANKLARSGLAEALEKARESLAEKTLEIEEIGKKAAGRKIRKATVETLPDTTEALETAIDGIRDLGTEAEGAADALYIAKKKLLGMEGLKDKEFLEGDNADFKGKLESGAVGEWATAELWAIDELKGFIATLSKFTVSPIIPQLDFGGWGVTDFLPEEDVAREKGLKDLLDAGKGLWEMQEKLAVSAEQVTGAFAETTTQADGLGKSAAQTSAAIADLKGEVENLRKKLSEMNVPGMSADTLNVAADKVDVILDQKETEVQKDKSKPGEYGDYDPLSSDEAGKVVTQGVFDMLDGIFKDKLDEKAKNEISNSVLSEITGMVSGMFAGGGTIASLGSLIGGALGTAFASQWGGEFWGPILGAAVGMIIEAIPGVLMAGLDMATKPIQEAFGWVGKQIRAAAETVYSAIQQFGSDLKSSIVGIGDLFPEERAGSAFKGTVEQMTPGGGVFGVITAVSAALAGVLAALAVAFVVSQVAIMAVTAALLLLPPLSVALAAGFLHTLPAMLLFTASTVIMSVQFNIINAILTAVILALVVVETALLILGAMILDAIAQIVTFAALLFLSLDPIAMTMLALGTLAGALTLLVAAIVGGVTLLATGFAMTPVIIAVGIATILAAIAAALSLGLTGLLTMFTFLAFKDVEGPYVDENGEVQEEYKSKREDVFAAFEGALDPLIIALDQLWAGVMPLAGLFATVVKVMVPMAKGFSNTEGLSRKLFYGLKAVAVGFATTLLFLGYFATGMLEIIAWMLENVPAGITTFMDQFGKAFLGGLAWILRGLAQFANALGLTDSELIAVADGLDEFALEPASDTLQDLADAARAMKPDLGAMATAIQELMDLTYEEAMAIAEEIAARKGLDLKEFNESLTNIPEGYKVSLARYLSMDEEGSGAVAGVSRNDDTLAEMNPDDYFNRLGQSWGGAFGDAYSFIGQLENEIARLADAINPAEWADLFGGSLESAFTRSLEGLDELFAETAEWVVNTVMPGDDAFGLGENGLEAGLGAGGAMGPERGGNITNIYVNDMNINDVDDATNFGERLMEHSEMRSMQQTGNPYQGGNQRGSDYGGGR
jgi:hypothetical protein